MSSAARLAAWYAEPQEPAAAQDALSAALADEGRPGRAGFEARLQAFIARWSLERPVTLDYRQLAATAPDPAEQARVELIWGQLLIARRLARAAPHLRAGFRAAVPYLSAAEYVELRRRHELLAWLPVGERPTAPAGLATLQAQARAIRRLTAALPPTDPAPAGQDPCDTIG